MQRNLRPRAVVGVALVGAGIVVGASLVPRAAQSPAIDGLNTAVDLTAGSGELLDLAPLAAPAVDNPQGTVQSVIDDLQSSVDNPQDVVVNPQDVVVPDCVVVDCVAPPVVVDPFTEFFNDIVVFFNAIVNEIDSLFDDALGFLP